MYDQILATVFSFPLADSVPQSSDSLKIALVAGLAAVLAATVPAFVGKREREPKVVRELRATEARLRDALERERDEFRTRALAAEAANVILDHEVDRLREMCLTATPPLDPGPRRHE